MSAQLKSLEEQLLSRANEYDQRARHRGASGNEYTDRARLFKELASIVALAEESTDD